MKISSNKSPMILKLSCSDRRGLVAEITGLLANEGANILELSQFTDPFTNWFFMRAEFETTAGETNVSELKARFSAIGNRLAADWTLSGQAGDEFPPQTSGRGSRPITEGVLDLFKTALGRRRSREVISSLPSRVRTCSHARCWISLRRF